MEHVEPNISRGRTRSAASASLIFASLLPQLVMLAICAARIRLWAKAPVAGELLALPMLSATQVIVAAVLLPGLAMFHRAWRVWVVGWPMGFLAMVLSAGTMRQVIWGELSVGVWILAIYFAVAGAEALDRNGGHRCRGVVWPIVLLWSLGGALLFYFRLEFASTLPPLTQFVAGPVVMTANIALGTPKIWFCPLLLPTVIFGLFFALARRCTRPKRASS